MQRHDGTVRGGNSGRTNLAGQSLAAFHSHKPVEVQAVAAVVLVAVSLALTVVAKYDVQAAEVAGL